MYEDWVRQAINYLCFTCEYKYVLVIWIPLGKFVLAKNNNYVNFLDIFFLNLIIN